MAGDRNPGCALDRRWLTLNAFRPPEAARYAYPVAIALILIFSATFSGYLSGRRGLIASAVFLVIAMPLNLWELRSGAIGDPCPSDQVRADSRSSSCRAIRSIPISIPASAFR